MTYRHKEAKNTYSRDGKIAMNTVSGADKGNMKNEKYAQSWDKPSTALDSTPYSHYQDSIQHRNKVSQKSNLDNLKQDQRLGEKALVKCLIIKVRFFVVYSKRDSPIQETNGNADFRDKTADNRVHYGHDKTNTAHYLKRPYQEDVDLIKTTPYVKYQNKAQGRTSQRKEYPVYSQKSENDKTPRPIR